jgi:hypothetical protein
MNQSNLILKTKEFNTIPTVECNRTVRHDAPYIMVLIKISTIAVYFYVSVFYVLRVQRCLISEMFDT